eukprot:CAMPEP_0203905580 /NCGR_PEP_ID=MMETSP0359-20131031/47287_1 /ASSEMBLY_ACC=CAM_ASM_000338 /TAXON_ID=268821 /ORGANISM="Scrippsiella Hangoei, Strain SHTV-5" /LENGTH=237 /DNA_ID=CAMNT_0050830059 /DNA_START=26 /DNA_END=739 /DNA_ORIENTATION=-
MPMDWGRAKRSTGQWVASVSKFYNSIPIVANYKAQYEIRALKDLLKAFGEVQTFERAAHEEVSELKRQQQEMVIKMEEENRAEVAKLMDRMSRLTVAARRERDLARQKQADEVRQLHDQCAEEMRVLRQANTTLHNEEVEYCLELSRLRSEYQANIEVQKRTPKGDCSYWLAPCCAEGKMSVEKERVQKADPSPMMPRGLSHDLAIKSQKAQGISFSPTRAPFPAYSPSSEPHPLAG